MNNTTPPIQIQINMTQPYMRREEFAKLIGVSLGTLNKMQENHLVVFTPKMKNEKGKTESQRGTVLVDMVATTLIRLKQAMEN